jgi:hypothetical protein
LGDLQCVIFISDFMKIGQLVQKLKGENINGDFISLIVFLRYKNRLKMLYFYGPVMHIVIFVMINHTDKFLITNL